ncbi:MAG TPA: AAA family ATPase [Bryobacteraceae bacterium]|nr:AAA family ATPase [Bryobacteraceae bacterium]
MLGDKRFLRTIKVQNILSFGPNASELELQSLNVLIGANGAGKSNLIETIALLQAAPGNLLEPIQTGGGIGEWLWKGGDSAPTGEIDVTAFYPQGRMPPRHGWNSRWWGSAPNWWTRRLRTHIPRGPAKRMFTFTIAINMVTRF